MALAPANSRSGAGVESVAVEGEAALGGAVTLSEGANVTLTQTGQDIEIAAAVGVESLEAEGETPLVGSVIIAAGDGIEIAQAGQTITISVA